MGKSDDDDEEWNAGAEDGDDHDDSEDEYVEPTPKKRAPRRSPKKTASATKATKKRRAPSTPRTKKTTAKKEKVDAEQSSATKKKTKRKDEDVVGAPQNTDAATPKTPAAAAAAAAVVDKLANYDKDAYKSHVTRMERRKAKSRAREKSENGTKDDTDDDDDDEEFDRPMPTIRGGYSHTKDAKKKIGLANKGKKPWNKGRRRSAEDRAKISAAVRARNRVILLKKLEGLGMTEEEWYAKKKKDKLEREQLRRQRVAEEKRKQKEAAGLSTTPEKKKNEKKAATTKATKDRIKATIKEEQDQTTRMIANVMDTSFETTQLTDATTKTSKSKTKTTTTTTTTTTNNGDVATAPLTVATNNSIVTPVNALVAPSPVTFAREIAWTPHPFDDDDDDRLRRACPRGGPGGLVCCRDCARSFSGLLTRTVKDAEYLAANRVRDEVTELRDLLRDASDRLRRALRESDANDRLRARLGCDATNSIDAVSRTAHDPGHEPTSIMDVCGGGARTSRGPTTTTGA